MEFRARDYCAEEESHALPRSRVDAHPLSTPSPSNHNQDSVLEVSDDKFFDPLRGLDVNSVSLREDAGDASTSSEAATQDASKEWISFKRVLLQKFPVSKVVSCSPISNFIMKDSEVIEESPAFSHSNELDGQQKVQKDDAKVITRQEYMSRVHELRGKITHAWLAEDRVTALKLAIKMAKLLLDTTVLQFYPTVFIAVTDMLDMLGDMVWKRIKQKAEFADDGTLICTLPNDFKSHSVGLEAKETCYNWFCKVGSIRELLPRIYLELAILPCWRFLHDRPIDVVQRLIMMMRAIADPLASMYCRLYMVLCTQKLLSSNTGYLITCFKDTEVVLMRILSEKETWFEHVTDDKKLLFSLMEPAIEYIMKCIVMAASQKTQGAIVLDELGFGKHQVNTSNGFPCVSVVLHHLLKELPPEIVSSHAMEILNLIKCSDDCSFSLASNYRLLGIRLSEEKSEACPISTVINDVFQVISQYDSLDEYLKVVDAFVDLVLENEMDNHLHVILEDIVKLACNKDVNEEELASLQSILLKLLYHVKNLKDLLALNHFLDILDLMYGNSRSTVYMHILIIATRDSCIRDPGTIQFLFRTSKALHDATDFASVKGDDSQPYARLISRFVQMIDYGAELERNLTFLVECRAAYSNLNELKDTLVRSSNNLATKALKYGRKHLNFVKSCIAFSEVTIPSASSPIRQLTLYLETAEVALLSGLVSHSDGLINSAITVLRDGSHTQVDMDGIVSLLRKLCSFLVMVPGNPEKGPMDVPKSISSLICSLSWITPRLKARIYCAIVLLSATLSQDKLPYYAGHPEITGSGVLFFGDSSYKSELLSTTELVLQKLVDCIEQEPSQAARGSMALEACNCIASAFKANDQATQLCLRFLETAKTCLGANHKHLVTTQIYLDKRLICLVPAPEYSHARGTSRTCNASVPVLELLA